MKTLSEAVEGFLVAQAGDVSESTRRWYRRRLGSFSEFAGPVVLGDVSVPMIRAFRAHLVERDLSDHYIHGCQRALRRFFAWLIAEGLVERNLAKEVPLIRLPHQAPKALTDDDLLRLLERLPHEDVRDRAIILLLADTGCRVGGLCSLTLDALDLPNRCATVVEKGQRGRRVYFTTHTAETLGLYLSVRPESDSPALFLSRSGSPLTTNGVRLMLERVGKRAGVKGRCNAHSFRHAFARSFLRNGGNLAALGRILGHSPGSAVTAKYYAVWDDRELQEYHERYSPLAKVGRAGDK
jgi:site-specific recombinase XerD